MVALLSLPERQCYSSAHISTVARLATCTNDTCGANGGHECATGECECAANGNGALLRRFTYPPLWGGVLIAVTTSWSMSWCHCSGADGRACGPGGLWMSWCIASSVASGPATGGGTAVIAVERCRCAATIVTPTAVLAPWVFVRWDHPTLEWEVASSMIPC
jgi:hypothetical protein